VKKRRLVWLFVPVAATVGVAFGFWLDRPASPPALETVYEEVQTVTAPRATGPSRIPDAFLANYDPHQVPLQHLIPADGAVLSSWHLSGKTPLSEQIIVTWDRSLDQPGYADGYRPIWLAVWQRFSSADYAGWRRVFLHRARAYDLEAELDDVTGDRRTDLLLREDIDGSAGCGIFRVIATELRHARQIYVRKHCLDQGWVHLRNGLLVEIDGVYFVGPGIHCCYRWSLTREKRWRGGKWITVRRTLRRLPPGSMVPRN
jgi:hypothetical protein